jgi:hypothetical protein
MFNSVKTEDIVRVDVQKVHEYQMMPLN